MVDWAGLRGRARPAIRGSGGEPWDAPPPTADQEAARRQEGRFLRRLWHSSREQWRRMAVLGALIWLGYAMTLGPGGSLSLIGVRREAHRVEREAARLEAACDSLECVIRTLERERPGDLERIAREEYGFTRDHERVYVLPDDAADRRCIDRSRDWIGGPPAVR